MSYPATTLKPRSKGGIYYVWCTVPEDIRPILRRKQTRKSTRTKDQRLAEREKHTLTKEIYAEFDKAYEGSKLSKTKAAKMAINNFAVTIGYDREPNIISGDTWDDTLEYDRLLKAKRELDLIAEYNYLMCFQWLHPLKDNWGRSAFLDFKDVADDDPEKLKLYNLVERYRENDVTDCWEIILREAAEREKITELKPHNQLRQTRYSLYTPKYPDEVEPHTVYAFPSQGLFEEDDAGMGDLRLNDVIDEYIASKTWNREKTKATAIRHLKLASRLMDNPLLGSISTREALNVMKAIIAESKADGGRIIKLATLNDIKSNLSVFMRYCVREEYSDSNPFIGLDITDLGADETVSSYVPFAKDELQRLFSLTMHQEDRLLLSILTVTGMRLDEAALLTWDQVKEEDGIKYLSLLDADGHKVIVKTKGSLRKVPLPDALTLPQRATGRLFSYTIDKDGKAQKEASKRLMKHVRRITNMKTKTIHSLRGTFKDLLRDAGISKELNDFITGHAQGDVAGKYGDGFSLERRYEAINSVSHPWLK